MPTVQVLPLPTAAVPLVSLALLKQQVRVDTNDEDELLQLYLDAAQQKVEAETGRLYGPHRLGLTYELRAAYELPAGATPVSVSGYFDTLDALAGLATYLEEYRKGISINRQLPVSGFLAQTYTVVVDTPGDTQYAALARRVILALAAESYKNREPTDLSVQWRLDLAPARLTVLGVS